MGAFLAEIGNTGLLTKEQEVELTLKAKVCEFDRFRAILGTWPV